MSSIEIYLRGTPWFLPVIGIAGVVVFVVLMTARRSHVVTQWLTVMSFVGFLAATVTPSGSHFPWGSQWNVSWSYEIPSLTGILAADYNTMNVWIAAPMGLATAYWVQRRPTWWLAFPYAVALAAELVQMVVPPLGRSAFLFGDVVNTWLGVTLGLALGWLCSGGRQAFGSARREEVG